MRPVVFAHRGASGQFAEHTRAAYLQALAEGADGVECDIHLTRDRQLVLIHDHTVDRTSNRTGRVADYTLTELREMNFFSWKGAELSAGQGRDQLLILDELLEMLRADGRPIRLAVECKHPDPFGSELESRLFELLTAAGWDAGSCTLDNISLSFMSFDPASVERLLAQVPARFICQLLEDPQQGLAAGQRNLDHRRVALAGPGIDYIRAHPEQVEEWIASGLTFRVWTVNSEEDIALCRQLGVQEVTTDWPARTAERFERAAGGQLG